MTIEAVKDEWQQIQPTSSPNINELAMALSKAQGEMKTPDKNKHARYPTKSGGMVEYNYADLAEVIECVRKPLADNGLAHIFSMEDQGKDGSLLVLTLVHSSGQWKRSELFIPGSADIKAFGANLTYLRRYMLSAMLDLHADEDMDGPPEDKGEYGKRRTPSQTPSISKNTAASGISATGSRAAAPTGPPSPFSPAPRASTAKPAVTPNAPTAGSSGPWKATAAELTELTRLANEKKWPANTLTAYMKTRFGKTKLSEYTEAEYKTLTDVVMNRPAAESLEAAVKYQQAEEQRNAEPPGAFEEFPYNQEPGSDG